MYCTREHFKKHVCIVINEDGGEESRPLPLLHSYLLSTAGDSSVADRQRSGGQRGRQRYLSPARLHTYTGRTANDGAMERWSRKARVVAVYDISTNPPHVLLTSSGVSSALSRANRNVTETRRGERCVPWKKRFATRSTHPLAGSQGFNDPNTPGLIVLSLPCYPRCK
jgi:hypothetical protein